MTTVAVTGTGFIGPVHVEALHRLGITVKGVLGSSPEKSEQAAHQLGLPCGYADYQAIIDDPEVDVVHITTPNNDHLDQATRALKANKHVVCEKPLAMDSRETEQMLQVARSKPNLVAAVNYNLRFYPMVIEAREMVRRSDIGQVFSMHGGYVQDWLLFDTDWNWRVEAKEGGALRTVGDIGSHWMDLLGFVTGLQIESLSADLYTFIPRRKKPRGGMETFKGKGQSGPKEYDLIDVDTEDGAAVMFRYENGARGSMNISQVTAGRKNRLTFEIAGSKASLAWDSERPNELWIGHRDRANEHLLKDPSLLSDAARMYANYPGGHNEGFPDTFKQLYRAIYGYIEAGDYSKPKPFPTFEDGHYGLVLMDAILESHRERRWIDIP
jgi:predicted dehydrogenase